MFLDVLRRYGFHYGDSSRGRRRLVFRTLTLATIPLAMIAIAPPASGRTSILDPSSPTATTISWLFWFLLALSVLVFVLMMGVLLMAAFRKSRGDTKRASPGGMGVVTSFGIGVPAVVLLGIFGVTFWALNDISHGASAGAETVEVVGHQWWWEVRYDDQDVTTANEVHIPVGKDVTIQLTSADVIHSFWVPELSDKIDVLPNHTNTLTLHADKAGTYRGQCAEFCGVQHANMALIIVAEPDDDYASWISQQQAEASMPDDPLIERGQQVYFNAACMYCHTIEGTTSSGEIGPDLTHVASREYIGAGTLENTEGNLAGWIVNSQSLKPNNQMPNFNLAPEDLQALIAYLESLK